MNSSYSWLSCKLLWLCKIAYTSSSVYVLRYVWVISVGLNMSAELIIVGSAMPVNITTLNIINEQEVLQTVSILNGTSDSFVAMFMPPSEEFKLQAIGVDDRGNDFSYISDVSVEPTSISLTFGK